MNLSLTGASLQVGDAFQNTKTDKELKLIASDPKETHTFKVTNYAALDGLLSKLQQSIIHMEGEGSPRACESPLRVQQDTLPRPTLPDTNHLPEPQLLIPKMAMTLPVLLIPPESMKISRSNGRKAGKTGT